MSQGYCRQHVRETGLGYRILDTVWDVLTQPSMSFRVDADDGFHPNLQTTLMSQGFCRQHIRGMSLGYCILGTVWDVLTQPSMSLRVDADAMMPP